MEDHIASGRLRVDVVLLQVGPADEDDYHDLGATVDYGVVAAEHARVVLVEVNEQTGLTATAEFSPYFSINSAVEVDLFGQLNSERAGGRYVGAVGGQVDFSVPLTAVRVAWRSWPWPRRRRPAKAASCRAWLTAWSPR